MTRASAWTMNAAMPSTSSDARSSGGFGAAGAGVSATGIGNDATSRRVA